MIKSLLGIDIGSYSIKIVELNYKKRLSLSNYTIIPIVNLPEEEKNKNISKLISTYIKEEKVKTKDAAISVAGPAVLVRYATFPKLPREELKRVIRFEADKYLPVNIEDVNVDIDVIGEVIEAGEVRYEVIIVAVDKKLVDEKIKILTLAKLKPKIVDVENLSLENIYELNYKDPKKQETVLLLNIGHKHTTLSIIENGVSRVIRDFPIGGENFTKVIQQTLNIDFESAEELKFKHGLTPTEEIKDSQKITNLLSNVMNELIGEIQKSMDYYYSIRGEYTLINRIFISGGSASLVGIQESITKSLRLPTYIMDPFLNIERKIEIPSEILPMLSVATGLALRVL